ncbi:NUDIX hydrolase [Bradyrhizobium sp. ARR65]|uniref:NUDIX hydrolase n=1 Tax=Bradyrhizobium sp. ARR65 TaxID=1040989 RepID=UPI000467B7A8|nr:NUDIX hydrolase [Bradyrhizobium sp. ARR65]
MARAPVLAAGGIVLRRATPPQIAVVRLRKRNEWVLPKGKLDNGETPRDAAEREVNEETGHDVTVHEFLGTLVYESGGRSKVVHYWRMEANGGPAYELMSDIREVEWLPLDAAVERLSRAYERAFLANVGPLALEAAASNVMRARAKPSAQRKRRSRPASPAEPPLAAPALSRPPIDVPAAAPERAVDGASGIPSGEVAAVEKPEPVAAGFVPAEASEPSDGFAGSAVEPRRRTLAALLRDWLQRAV